MIDVRPDAQCGLRLDARVLDCRFNQNLDYFSLRVKAPEPVMHMVRELRHLAGEKWLAFDGLKPLMERLANNRPKLHVALKNLELTITKDTHSMRALIKEFTPCQWSNDEKAWVGIFGNDAEVRDTLNVILEFCARSGAGSSSRSRRSCSARRRSSRTRAASATPPAPPAPGPPRPRPPTTRESCPCPCPCLYPCKSSQCR